MFGEKQLADWSNLKTKFKVPEVPRVVARYQISRDRKKWIT
jgi:hypothetical protein